VAPGGLPGLGLGVHPAPAAHDPLDVLRRPGAPHPEQPLLGLRGGHAGERPHLGVREFSSGEGLGQPRQRAERAGHPDALAGRARVEPDAPTQPGGAGAEAAVPAAAGVELSDQVEQVRGGGVEVRRQLGDLVTEPIQLRCGPRGGGDDGREESRFHE